MHLRFEDKHVQEVPEKSGIFCLWDHTHLVYVGRTAPRSNLRAEVQHALTMAMAEDLSATHFTYEVTTTPKTRAAEELRDFYPRRRSSSRSCASLRAATSSASMPAARSIAASPTRSASATGTRSTASISTGASTGRPIRR